MIKVSLTDFSEFVLKAGAKKQTKVRQIVNRPKYEPQFDFWKKLRERIIDLHKTAKPTKELQNIISELTDDKKKKVYPGLVKGYLKFIGRKKPTWFAPPKGEWSHEDLAIRVNPEIGLEFNGKKHVIKLHLNQSIMAKNEADIILTLMKSLGDEEDIIYCLLDVKTNKLYRSDKIKVDLLPVLQGEAMSFISIWKTYTKAA